MRQLRRLLHTVVVLGALICLPFFAYNLGGEFLPAPVEEFLEHNDWLRWVAVVAVVVSLLLATSARKHIQHAERQRERGLRP